MVELKIIGISIFVFALVGVLWLMFRDPPPDTWDGGDLGDGGYGGS
jgi:hypothetical protein